MNFLYDRKIVKKIGLQPKIHNIVVSADSEKSIDLEALSQNLKIIYEPEQFPGAIMRLEEPFKTSVLIFASGKIVIAGLTSEDQIGPVTQIIERLIESNQ